jgi:hypothetical protein
MIVGNDCGQWFLGLMPNVSLQRIVAVELKNRI